MRSWSMLCDYSSVGIYLDTVNIFIRIAMILAGGGGNRRKWRSEMNFDLVYIEHHEYLRLYSC